MSAVPNHQVNRITPLSTRANVACFGTFGYELDLNQLTEKEREQVREQIAFMKEYRQVLQFGDFYRLLSPFDSNFTAWMAVSQDKRTALAGWYKTLNEVNGPYRRIKLQGLNPEYSYTIDGGDSRFGFLCDTIDMWGYAVPLGFLSAFLLRLPVMWVYFLLCTDEFVKWPWVIRHYRSGRWLNNITRDGLFSDSQSESI